MARKTTKRATRKALPEGSLTVSPPVLVTEEQSGQSPSSRSTSTSMSMSMIASPLPMRVHVPTLDLCRATTMIYGPPKIGKTTLASQWPGPWFLATEPGQEWIEVHEPTIIESWSHFLDVCKWISDNRPTQFGTGKPLHNIVVDTADLLFKMCYDTMCEEMGIANAGELDYGAGWSYISDEFSRVITKLARLPYGLILISHSREREIRTRTRKIDRTEPAMMTTGFKVVGPLADLILYCGIKEVPICNEAGEITGIDEKRIIRCQPEANLVAGDRTQALPDEIPMSYAELVKYFPATAITEKRKGGNKQSRKR